MYNKFDKILRTNGEMLKDSPKDMKAIFTIMFRQRDIVLCETNDGFRVQKQTYGQIHDRIVKTAGALYAKVGANHSYIALEMENCPDWVVAFWAILKSGNKPYLVNTRYPESLTAGILKTLQAEYILCAESTKLPGTALSMADLQGDFPAPPEDVFENELAFSSSATSMNEVICFYTGAQIAAQVLNFPAIVKENPRIAADYKGNLKLLAFLPFYHVFGLFAVYFWFGFFGCTLVFLRDYSADTILKTCRRHQVTHIFAVPLLWHTIEKQVWAEAAKQGPKQENKLRKALKFSTDLQNLFPFAGAAIAKKLCRQVTDKLFGPSVMFCINGGSYLRDSALALMNGLGYSMHNGYGMSEIGITSVELRRRPKDKNRNAIGHPFTAVQYRLDENGVAQVKGSTLCVKKLVNGQPVTLDDWFDTGDYMQCIDGHYYIQGRRSDTVIGENGENINPDTVEKAFTLTGALQWSVLGLPGQNGQELSLVVQLSPYATDAMASQVKTQAYAINQTLPTAMAVKQFFFTQDELAPAGAVKVGRPQLTKKIAEKAITLTPFSQFQAAQSADGGSPLLEKICSIVAQVLELDKSAVGSDSHIFYDLGATSIQYFSILGKLAEEFSVSDYGSGDSYCYTPRQICEYIESKL